jgi:hypothetical protein
MSLNLQSPAQLFVFLGLLAIWVRDRQNVESAINGRAAVLRDLGGCNGWKRSRSGAPGVTPGVTLAFPPKPLSRLCL